MESLHKHIPPLVAFQPQLLEVFLIPRYVVKIPLSYLLADSLTGVLWVLPSVVLRRPRFRIFPENVLFLVRFLHLSSYGKVVSMYTIFFLRGYVLSISLVSVLLLRDIDLIIIP